MVGAGGCPLRFFREPAMSIIYAGTPDFAAASLAAILDAGFPVALVLTQPDRPAGRGMSLQPSPVKRLALERGLPVYQPLSLRDAEAQARLAALQPELMIVAAYGLILPQAVLDIPRRGCVNVHASLLPRWRGAAPIQRAILAGDATSGVCLMGMEKGLDTGPVFRAARTPIGDTDTGRSLHDRLASLGARLLADSLPELLAGSLRPVPQPADGVTYAAKLDKAEAPLDWRRPAAELHRQVRAFDPVPGATASLDGVVLKIWGATPVPDSGTPGQVLAVDRQGIVVACGTGALRLTELQKPGGKRLPVAQFLAGHALAPGAAFALPALEAGNAATI